MATQIDRSDFRLPPFGIERNLDDKARAVNPDPAETLDVAVPSSRGSGKALPGREESKRGHGDQRGAWRSAVSHPND